MKDDLNPFFAAVNRAALPNLRNDVETWIPGGKFQGDQRYVVKNPQRDDRKAGSFSVNLRTGAFFDFAAPEHKGGDVVALRAFVDGTSQMEAAKALAREYGIEIPGRRQSRPRRAPDSPPQEAPPWLDQEEDAIPPPGMDADLPPGPPPPVEQARNASEADRVARKQAAIRQIWGGAVDPAHPRVTAYFRSRGLHNVTLGEDVRFHPNLAYYRPGVQGEPPVIHVGDYPAIVMLVKNVEGRVTGLHRLYLSNEDDGKLWIPDPQDRSSPLAAKKLLSVKDGANVGSAVRVDPPAGKRLHLAEGLETILAVRQAWREPAWSTISAHMLKMIVLPPSIQDIWIWGDKDASKTGQTVAHELAQRLEKEGRRLIHVRIPQYAIPDGKSGIDFLDVLNQHGPESLLTRGRRMQNWLRGITLN